MIYTETLPDSIFYIGKEVKEELSELIDNAISLLPEQASYSFIYADSNSEFDTHYTYFDRYSFNLFDTRIFNIISLHNPGISFSPSSPELFRTKTQKKANLNKALSNIRSFCRSHLIPFFCYIVIGNDYYDKKMKDEEGNPYVFQQAGIEFISDIVSPRDLKLFLENDLITKSLRYTVGDYYSAEGLLKGTAADVDIYYEGEN